MKKLFISLLILSEFSLFSLSAHAQSAVNTLASQFAMQAGTIAGAVQSCGQSIVEYNSRVVEGVNTLAKSPSEQMQAMTIYQKALSETQDAQNRTHSINCSEAMQSFNSLPLMQADYKKTVLPQLAKMANPAPASPTMAAPGSGTSIPVSPPPATPMTGNK
jgi:hypothetical protein